MFWFGGDVHFGERGGAALEDLRLDRRARREPRRTDSKQPRPSSAQALNPPDAAARLKAANVIAAGIDNNHALDGDDPTWTWTAPESVGIAPLGHTSTTSAQVDFSKPTSPFWILAASSSTRRPVIALFHVLAEPLYLPDSSLREAVDLAVKSGASAVLAHGSHAIGAVERRGSTVIAWGLGNLAFDCDCTTEDEGLLVRLEVDGRTVTKATAIPVRAGLHGARARLPDDASLDLALLEVARVGAHQQDPASR